MAAQRRRGWKIESPQQIHECLDKQGQRAACDEHEPEPLPAPGPKPGRDGRDNRGSKDARVVQESAPYRARAQVDTKWNDQHDQN